MVGVISRQPEGVAQVDAVDQTSFGVSTCLFQPELHIHAYIFFFGPPDIKPRHIRDLNCNIGEGTVIDPLQDCVFFVSAQIVTIHKNATSNAYFRLYGIDKRRK